MWLSIAVAAQQSGGVSLGQFGIAVGILATVISGLWALKRYNDKQREKWIYQGKQEQDLSDQLEKNAEATKVNTAAIDKLVGRMDGFASRVDGQLNGHDKRIEKLEEYASYGTAPYRRNNLNRGNP